MAIARISDPNKPSGLGRPPTYMLRLKIDERELKSRMAFFEISDDDLKRLTALKGFAEKYTVDITEGLYELILGHPETRAFFPDEATVKHVKAAQNAYFLQLFEGRCDLSYVENRLKVGEIHEKIGMPPKWYLGAYRRYLKLIFGRLLKEFPNLEEAKANFDSLKKLIFFDMSLAIDTYIAAHLDTVARQKIAIRELSTPVIQVHQQILLLPLVGTIDTQRAQQIMESVLSKVIQSKAKVIIIDIAGVPVVDTKVADHIIRTTAATRLLGTQSILTGISAEIAQTIVQLGIEIDTMYTQTGLSQGIELALDIIGRKIVKKERIRKRKEA